MLLFLVINLTKGPKNNHIKHVLGSILTPALVLYSFLIPAEALKNINQ